MQPALLKNQPVGRKIKCFECGTPGSQPCPSGKGWKRGEIVECDARAICSSITKLARWAALGSLLSVAAFLLTDSTTAQSIKFGDEGNKSSSEETSSRQGKAILFGDSNGNPPSVTDATEEIDARINQPAKQGIDRTELYYPNNGLLGGDSEQTEGET
ncbi:unnamed protein product, partial [Notodromas monacha]